MTDFQGFPKIARLFRDVVITEKIDGTNGAIGIEQTNDFSEHPFATPVSPGDGFIYAVYAQSRSRIIHPGMDNHGFANWVWANAETLVADLGPGLHFGEWWGSGIQRGYGMPKGEKRFSLFNTKRWTEPTIRINEGGFDVPLLVSKQFTTPGLGTVPVLYAGPFSTGEVTIQLSCLEAFGSVASPGFMNPEGVVVYHTAANTMFKATIHGDEKPKSVVKPDELANYRNHGARGTGMSLNEYLAMDGLAVAA